MSSRFHNHYLLPEWQAPAGVRAFVSTRTNSPAGPAMNDSTAPDFARQREQWLRPWGARLMAEWNWRAAPCWALQVHGTDVIAADSAFGTPADGVWSQTPGLPCTILTADCLPVLFCNHTGTKVAAAHAGWRGLVNGVLESTVAALDEPGEQLQAWLGPAISQPCFEVGPEVRQAFMAVDAAAERAFVPGRGDRWFADLYRLARLRLERLGIRDISGGDHCTVTEADQFYSWRREGRSSGRLLSAIWIDPEH